VTHFSSNEEALDPVGWSTPSFDFDAAILDHNTRGLYTGVELADVIRQRTHDIPIIISTNNSKVIDTYQQQLALEGIDVCSKIDTSFLQLNYVRDRINHPEYMGYLFKDWVSKRLGLDMDNDDEMVLLGELHMNRRTREAYLLEHQASSTR